MSDIWSVGGSDNESVDKGNASEDWDINSSSGEEEERPRKRSKRVAGANKRPKRPIPNFDDSQPTAVEQPEEEGDDILAGFLSPGITPNKAAKGSKKAGKSKADDDGFDLLDDDDDLDLVEVTEAAAPARAAAAAAAPGAGAATRSSKRKAAANGGPSPDVMRQAAAQQRLLREQLAQATHAAEEQDDDVEVISDADDDAAPFPAARGGLANGAEDPNSLLDDLVASQPEPAAAAAAAHAPAGGGSAAAAAAGAADVEGKLPLVFQAQGHDKVTVMVQRDQPLSEAMEKVTKYAADNGWGRVSKFVFDDEKLSGQDTPEDLGMEEDEVIDVYLDS